jgi:hypothetical protein
MHQDNVSPPPNGVRRFGNAGETVELAFAAMPSPSMPATCRVFCDGQPGDDGALAYIVDLPEHASIRPVDWRRFAYDHAKIAARVQVCVQDNLMLAIGHHGALAERHASEVESTLASALRDLGSIYDVASVQVEFVGDDLLVRIEGEFKNGERSALCIQCRRSLDDLPGG